MLIHTETSVALINYKDSEKSILIDELSDKTKKPNTKIALPILFFTFKSERKL